MWSIALLVLFPMATELLNLHWLFYVTCTPDLPSKFLPTQAGGLSLRPRFTEHRFQTLLNPLCFLKIHLFFQSTEIILFSCDSWSQLVFFETCNAYFSLRPQRMLIRFICTVSLTICSLLILWDTSTFMLQEMRTTESCRTHECKNCLEGMEQFSPNYSQLESALFAVILR